MLKTLLLILVISWFHTGAKGQSEVTFDPPSIGKEDTKVKMTATYNLNGGSADELIWSVSNKDLAQVTVTNGEASASALNAGVSEFEDISNRDQQYSITYSGNWCTLPSTYQLIVRYGSGSGTIFTSKSLNADSDPSVTLEVDGVPVSGVEVEVSKLTGKVTCTAYSNTRVTGLQGIVLIDNAKRETIEALSEDSDPAPCTKKASAETDFDFKGRENEGLLYGCDVFGTRWQLTLKYNPEVTTTVRMEPTQKEDNEGDDTGDITDGDKPGDGGSDNDKEGDKEMGDDTGDNTDGEKPGDGGSDKDNEGDNEMGDMNASSKMYPGLHAMVLVMCIFGLFWKIF